MSKVTLVFEGENATELQKQVEDYLKTASVVAPALSAPTPAKEAPKSAKGKKEGASATPAKEAAPAPAEEVEDANPFDTDEEAEPEEAPLSFESVAGTLKEVGEKVGVAKVRDILKEVGLKKVADLKETHFAKVMGLCKKALA